MFYPEEDNAREICLSLTVWCHIIVASDVFVQDISGEADVAPVPDQASESNELSVALFRLRSSECIRNGEGSDLESCW